MGQSYMTVQDYSNALKELLEGVRLNPDDPDIHNLLAQAYQRKSAYAQAESHYFKALKLKQEDPYIYNNIGALYLDMQRWNDAAVFFRKAADNLVFQYPVGALTGLGIAQHRAGEYIQAVMAYREALKLFPNNLSVMYLQAQSYVKMGKYSLAEETLEQALKIDPLDNIVRFEYAKTLLEQDKKSKAREQFREVSNREDKTPLGKEAREYVEMLD